MFTRMKLGLAIALGRMLGKTPLSVHRAAMDHNHTVEVLRDLEDRRTLRQRMASAIGRLIPHSRAKGNGYKGPNGVQAMARRVRQIAAGMLTGSNGLLRVEGGYRQGCDSHGVPGRFYW